MIASGDTDRAGQLMAEHFQLQHDYLREAIAGPARREHPVAMTTAPR